MKITTSIIFVNIQNFIINVYALLKNLYPKLSIVLPNIFRALIHIPQTSSIAYPYTTNIIHKTFPLPEKCGSASQCINAHEYFMEVRKSTTDWARNRYQLMLTLPFCLDTASTSENMLVVGVHIFGHINIRSHLPAFQILHPKSVATRLINAAFQYQVLFVIHLAFTGRLLRFFIDL